MKTKQVTVHDLMKQKAIVNVCYSRVYNDKRRDQVENMHRANDKLYSLIIGASVEVRQLFFHLLLGPSSKMELTKIVTM